ncbi:MAG: hypothetical protein GYB68_00735 [Chloroflexi bacterium]|nr:hypothetical protein [Chloroflexota bacterium]
MAIRNGTRAGLIFGFIMVFLILIGVPETINVILQEATTNIDVETGQVINTAAFLFVMGVVAGFAAARKEEPDPLSGAVLSGLIAGLITGATTGLMIIILRSLALSEIDLREYLDKLSPTAIESLALRLSPILAGGAHVLIFALSGATGGLLNWIGRGPWRGPVGQMISNTRDRLARLPIVAQAQNSPITRYVVWAAVIAVVMIVPQFLNDYWSFVLGTVGIYVIMGLGLNIVVGMAGLLDLGNVAFFAVGAYTVGLLTAPEPVGVLWDFWTALIFGIVLAGLAGVILGVPVLRLRGDYLAIVTLGLGEIIRILIRSDLLKDFTGGPRGVRDISGPSLFGLEIGSERTFLYFILVGIFLLIFVTIRLKNSRVGRAWIAMREDETVAQAMGINTLNYKLLAFGMGAAFAGLGGVLFASRNQFTGPEDHTLLVSINVLAVVIVGGMNSIPGVILGAFALKGLPEILRQLDEYRVLVFGGLLVVMMILRPEGLWPSQRTRLQFSDEDEPVPIELSSATSAAPTPIKADVEEQKQAATR